MDVYDAADAVAGEDELYDGPDFADDGDNVMLVEEEADMGESLH